MKTCSPLLTGFSIVLGSLVSSAQDTLAPGVACYDQIVTDWKDFDDVARLGYRAAITAMLDVLPAADRTLIQSRLDAASSGEDLETLYLRAASARRAALLAPYIDRFRKVIFSQHDARGGQYFFRNVERQGGYAGKGLELLTMNGYYGTVTHLLPTGEARDPDISFDGKRVLFSWRGGESGGSNYRLFEMDLESKSVRQITQTSASAAGYQWGSQDIESCYLPNGNILFVSSRHVQEIDCIPGPAVNLFLCDKDGRYIRQAGFDQVPTNYPRVLPSGEVVYARWDYNDKSHIYAHGLFVMNPDGTAQREYYGNNSWWPSMILQQRPIPGTNKVMAMIGGYHTQQSGKIGIIDNSVGMQNGRGITLLSPVRTPAENTLEEWGPIPQSINRKAENYYPWEFDDTQLPTKRARPIDRWGRNPPQFAYPWPLDEKAFIVSCRPEYRMKAGDTSQFFLYFFTADNRRELLYADKSCVTPVVVAPRTLPPTPSSPVDYRDSTGVFQVMDVYVAQSPVMDGVKRGTVKRLRVCGLEYRPGPAVAHGRHWGPGDLNLIGATYNNPIATNNASWDLKWIIGETPVYEDGSASFIVPARTPLFFQLLDGKGEVVQTMRSWSTLQPGEVFACIGCHESKLEPPPPISYVPEAIKRGPKKLEPFYGPPRVFGFAKEIQPILNEKCITCHNGSKAKPDLRGTVVLDKRKWAQDGTRKSWIRSYSNLTRHDSGDSHSKYVNWFHAESVPILQPPYRNGSRFSPLIDTLENGHKGVKMTKEEIDKFKCWIDIGVPHSGSYIEGLSSADRTATKKNFACRAKWVAEEKANIAAYVAAHPSPVKRRVTDGRRLQTIRRGISVRTIGGGVVRISVDTDIAADAAIDIFDSRGRLVRSLVLGMPGDRTFVVKGLPSGRYFVRLKSATSDKTLSFVTLE